MTQEEILAQYGPREAMEYDVVVVGGGLSLVPQLWPPMRQAVKEHARLDYLRDLSVVPAALGQRAGLVGAAALFDDRYWSPSA